MAIAFDLATEGNSTTGTSLTYAHTCTGSDRILFVGCQGTTGGTNNITGVTYAGISMTKVTDYQINIGGLPTRWNTVFILVNPASGSNNVVVSGSPSDYIASHCASYTGAAQTGQPDASATDNNGAVGASFAIDITTIADNCWAYAFTLEATGGRSTAGTGTVQRTNDTPVGQASFDSNAALTPAGAKTLNVNYSPDDGSQGIIVSFAPSAAAAAGVIPTLLTLGVG